MLIDELKIKMKNGYVSFKYTKKNGEERLATGTLNVDLIAEENATPSGNGWGYRDEYKETTTRYYDKIAGGWRSFVNDNLIEIY